MVRKYGSLPYKAAVIHGGPGAPGYMAPVARKLSSSFGVLEPIQSAQSLEGQIIELQEQLGAHCDKPICLIGSSWGATLALLYTARFNSLINKFIIIGSCVYDAASSEEVKRIRSNRMSEEDTRRSQELAAQLIKATGSEKNEIFRQLSDCSFRSDTYDPETTDLEIIDCEYETNKSVWADFKAIRDTPGELKNLFSNIDVPVVNIQGVYDPHIIEGIQPFLESCLKDIRLYLLEKSGHYPWIEREAKNQFFEILVREVGHGREGRAFRL